MATGSSRHVRVCLLTPPGRGALAVVGAAGQGAMDLIAGSFTPRGGRPLADRPDGSLAYGRWGDPQRGEELVVVRLAADRFEVHCHGGLAASAAVLAGLEARGARRQTWGEWLGHGGFDDIAAEARAALAVAGGPKAAHILCRQLAGALRMEIDRIESLHRKGNRNEAHGAVARLLAASRIGLRLTRPWRVVVVGPVNAGKSSLVNAIAGHARSIVSAEPGTTRDVLETRIVLDGWEIDLVDTAGWADPAAAISATEHAGIERGSAAATAADLILDVADISRPTPSVRRECGSGPGEDASAPRITVASQCDRSLAGPEAATAIRTSAVTGEGIDGLARSIVRALVPEEDDAPALLAGPVPFTPRQVAMLGRLRAAVRD